MESAEPATTFADVAKLAVRIVIAGNRDHNAIRINLRKLSDWFSAMPVDTITEQDLAAFGDAMHADGRSASTVTHRMAKFNKIINFAKQRGMVSNPPSYRDRRRGRQLERVFASAECDRLIAGLNERGSAYGQFGTALLLAGLIEMVQHKC